MAVLATDDFNRANSTDLGTAWDPLPSPAANCQIVSNTVRPSVDDTACYESYNAVTWPNDQYSEITLANVSGAGAGAGSVVVRAGTVGLNTYVVDAFGDKIEIWKAVSGSWTLLGSWTGTVANTDIIRAEAQGTTIRALHNGTQRISVTDSAHASGRSGVGAYVTLGTSLASAQVDSWHGGDFGAVAALLLPGRHPMSHLLVR